MASNTEGTFGVCRTCLEPISKQSASDSLRKLSTCFPELNLALTSNPALCNTCEDAINSSLKFKRLCYQTEVRILKYIQQAGSNITTADLAQIANRNESAVVDLLIKEEIKQESGNDCMDNTLEGSWVQQNISSQRASTDNSSSDKSGEKMETTKKCYRKRSGGEIVYRCDKCPYRSTYKLQFGTHIRTHLTKSGYRILEYIQRKKREKCNKTQKQRKITLTAFNGRNNLKPHTQMPRRKTPTICNQKPVENHKLKRASKKDFQCVRGRTKCSLKGIIEIHRRGKPFSCNQCDFNTKYKQSLKRHMVIHTTEKKCQHCDYSTKHKRNLKDHMVIHTTEEFNCHHCDFSTKFKRNLKNHMVIHTTEEFKCQHCEFSTKHKRYLKDHMVIHTTEEFNCHHCDFSTKYKRNLKNHMVIHTTEEFKCQHCEFSTKHKRYLKDHMVIHTTEEFKCQHCDYSTKYKRNLKNHMVIHTTEEFKCHNCDFSTKHKYYLKSHMVIHATEKFKCQHCEFSTKHKGSLKRHMVVHTTEEFKCQHCEFSTKYKRNLKNHIVTHTTEECTI